MKKLLSLLLSVVFTISGTINSFAYDFSDESITPILVIDGFDQSDTSLSMWFRYLPHNSAKGQTYRNLLQTDYFASTLHELFIQLSGTLENESNMDIFCVDDNTRERIIAEYHLDGYGIYCVYELDKIQILFNEIYGTNIDFASLDGLTMEGDFNLIKVCGSYLAVQISPHGWMEGEGIYPKSGINLRYNNYNDKTDYWEWCYYEQNYNEIYPTVFDKTYTIVTYKNVLGYNIRAIEYMSFTPPSDELLDSYIYGNRNDGITVLLDDEEINFDQPPFFHNDRTMVPIRTIFEAMGADVYWDEYSQTVTAEKDETKIELTIGAYTMYKDGYAIALDAPAMLVNGRTLIPARFVAEAFGYAVNWDGSTNTVFISGGTSLVWRQYYESHPNVLDFGAYIEKEPYLTYENSYYYEYYGQESAGAAIDEYVAAMEQEGYILVDAYDENGADWYYLYKSNDDCTVELIDDYLLEHVEIHIDYNY